MTSYMGGDPSRALSAIRDLIALNALLVDQRRFDEWVLLYCDNGVHESGGVCSQGPEELRRYIEKAVPSEGLVHLCGRSLVELQSTTEATAVTSWLSVRKLPGPTSAGSRIEPGSTSAGSRIELAFAGRYIDRFEMTENGWLFAYRFNDLLGDA